MISEEHIVIGKDRHITVPKALQRIAVQYDHNVETVTFDCPRYWDEHDMSKMTIYIAYMRKDRYRDKDVADNITIDGADPNIIHFNWTVSKNATMVNGPLKFIVCIVQVDDDGNEVVHWNSEINNQMFISEGMECNDYVVSLYPDIITDLLVRMDNILEANGTIIDKSLTERGLAAEAKATGDAIAKIQSDVNYSVTTTSNAIRNETTARKAEIAVERQRINKLASLSAGSTTGDAELIDARIGFTGIEYDSAGDAVRGQANSITDYVASVVSENPNNLFDPMLAMDNTGYVTETGETTKSSTHWITPKMNVSGMTQLFYNQPVYKYACYDSNGSYLADASGLTYTTEFIPITIASNVAYVGLQFEKSVVSFEDRYNLICTDMSTAIDPHETRYRIDSDSISGPLSIVPDILIEDANNLFDPTKAHDNVVFSTPTGAVFKRNGYWCTNYIDISEYSGIMLSKQPYKIGWYDENGSIIDVRDDVNIPSFYYIYNKPEGTKYVLVQYESAIVPFDSRFDIVISSIENNHTNVKPRYRMYDDCVINNLMKIDTKNYFNPMNALNSACFTSADGLIYHNEQYWITDFIRVNDATSFTANKTIYKRAWFDANKKHIATSTEMAEGAYYVLFQFLKSEVPFEKRFELVICDQSTDIRNVNPYYYIHNANVSGMKILGDHRYRFPLSNATYMSDHTFIKGKLYVANASNDAHTDTNNVTVYTVDNESGTAVFEKMFTHNLGHCNSIDYCAGNDCLIMGNGSGDTTLPGEIYILKNPAERETWNYGDCIRIDVSSEGWGFKTNVVWGDHNNSQYNIIYVITNNNANIRKVLLTKTDGEFDGGYVVLDSWETKAIDVNQGSVYRNGKLYMAIGHSQVWLLECTLKPNGVIDIQEYKDMFYDETGAILSDPFNEGITIEDGYVYVGTWDGYIQVYKYWG